MENNTLRRLEILSEKNWKATIDADLKKKTVCALEEGKVLFFPELQFQLDNHELHYLLNAQVIEGTKNISYHFLNDTMRGSFDNHNAQQELKKIMRRFSVAAQSLIASYFPAYLEALQIGRTSLRPIEIFGRQSPSYRKDDTRLHVDAFPANPNQGRRILRVFYNYNPEGKSRVWRLGEPFINVASHFLPKVKKPIYGTQWFLKTFKITKSIRTRYDHIMLQIHDGMKFDVNYQKKADAQTIEFPALSTWIVYTDSVSHAALSGQHVLEQTFYLPVFAMNNSELAPLHVLEQMLGQKLV
jgi:hypothetical protein